MPKETVFAHHPVRIKKTLELETPSIKKAGRICSLSAEQTGTGSAQSIAHGLGVVPSLVMMIITGSPSSYAALSVVEGTHTSTNVVVTVTANWKFKVYAEA